MSFMKMYRQTVNECSLGNITEEECNGRCNKLFAAALKDGDRRMAMELSDCIITAAENNADIGSILKSYGLLVTYFPDIATQTLEMLTEI